MEKEKTILEHMATRAALTKIVGFVVTHVIMFVFIFFTAKFTNIIIIMLHEEDVGCFKWVFGVFILLFYGIKVITANSK